MNIVSFSCKYLYYTTAIQSFRAFESLRHRISQVSLNYLPKPQKVTKETTYELALRFAKDDTTYSRVKPLISQLTEQQRYELAKLEIKKIDGITDSCHFARTELKKYELVTTDYVTTILQELDKKSSGYASKVIR